MKKLLLALSIIITSIIFGCSESFEDEIYNMDFKVNKAKNSSNFVTLNCVQALVKIQHPGTRSDASSDINILCYEDAEHDTLLYICDKVGGGWTIYAPDMRVPPVLAQSETGTFAHASENEALMAWVSTIAEDMKIIKHASDAELNFTPSEIESNKKFWRSICFPDNYAKEITSEQYTKAHRDYPLNGHYEFYSVESYIDTIQYVGRLTQTDWHQNSLYNFYCPRKTYLPYLQAPAGCVAIAGAQMLYYLHYNLGVPDTAPSEAYCNSFVNDDPYDMGQSNFTSTIWSSMNPNPIMAAPLIANVGQKLGTHYGNSESSASTSDLNAYVFPTYGIYCDYDNYIDNIDAMDSSLVHQMPVILRAAVSGSKTDAHTFIVDRYVYKKVVVKTTYIWVYDSIPLGSDGNEMPVPIVPDKVSYMYIPFKMIGMNWGWGPSYNSNDEWFIQTGDWTINNVTYTDNRYMVHNFRLNY